MNLSLRYPNARSVAYAVYHCSTAAASAILTETYGVSDLDDILACVHSDNAASIRVLEKLGFCFSHSRLSKPIGRDMPVYRIDRKTYTETVQP